MEFLILSSSKTVKVISDIAYAIPCKINAKSVGTHRMRLFVECKSQYFNFVKKKLAPFM